MSIVTIIIPIYNASKYIDKAVNSVLAQSIYDFELILVDDGSIDSSPTICDEFASKDSRVKVIHQKNSGVSAARNSAINIAQGKYIGFVDADDWIEPDMYYDLVNFAEEQNADIVMCDATIVYENGKTQLDTITQLSKDSSLSKADLTPELLLELAGSSCRCLYKRMYTGNDKQDAYTFHFPLGVKFSEDRIFNLYNFSNANKIYYKKTSYYNRWINQKSTVHRFHRDYFETIKKSHNETMKAIEIAWNNDPKYKNAYNIHFINGAFMAICNYFYLSSTMSLKEKIEAIKKIGINRKTNLILNNRYYLLILYAILSNIKQSIFLI